MSSKQDFWNKQIVLKCPKCGKGYKSHSFMMAHFSRVHNAVTLEQQLALFEKAVDNWNKKCKERS